MSSLAVAYNSSTLNFELFDFGEAQPKIEFTYGHMWQPIPSTDGLLLLLWSTALPESQVLQATVLTGDDDQTVGWLCTVSALTSDQHQFHKNQYFRKAAGHAMQMLLELDSVQEMLGKQPNSTSDAFPERACVFIALKSLLPVGLQKEPGRLLPQLHKYGFYPYTFGLDQNSVSGKLANANLMSASAAIKKIRISEISETVPFFGFIESLLTTSLALRQDPAYRFFLYYQIIELLMEEVQRHKQLTFVNELNAASGDATQLYDLIQELGQQTSEEGRITALFQSYTKVPSTELDGLKTECIAFLDQMDRKKNVNDCSKVIYRVRNMLMHNMRRIPTSAYQSLSLINEYLEVVVPTLLITFALPGIEIKSNGTAENLLAQAA